MRILACALLALGLFPGVRALAGPDPGRTNAARSQALAFAHDGRFAEAREVLAGLPDDSRDPRSSFFPAYVDYWALIYDPDNEALRARFERELDRTVEIVDSLPDHDTSDAAQWAGTARLLLAQLRAWERHPLSAAFEAGRAKRLLDRYDRSGPASTDHLFALGTYNYMADRVSTFVKGIRALLFLPGGDEELGLRQLERAAEESTYFRLDARLLLATVYSHRKERRYGDAQREIDRALQEAGDTVAARHAAARFALTLARPEAAAAYLDGALADANLPPRADPTVLANLELLRAKADLAQFRPDLALPRLESLLAARTGVPPDVREDGAALASEARVVLENPAWERVRTVVAPGNGNAPGSPDPIAAIALAVAHPADAAAALMAGRALLRASEPGPATEWLRRAEAASADLPPPWVGPCLLMTGQALDLQGKRQEAITFYQRAAEAAPFTGRDAAHYWQTTPYRAGS